MFQINTEQIYFVYQFDKIISIMINYSHILRMVTPNYKHYIRYNF